MAGRRHTWRKNDDLVAFYIFRYGPNHLPKTPQEIATILGMSEASLIMRLKNFASFEGEHGLNHVARQSVYTHEQYRQTPQAELRSLVVAATETAHRRSL
jgi:hypothetical protein